jgi:hypothetical protein
MVDCKSGTAVVMVWFHTPSASRDKIILVFVSTLLMDFYHHLACKNTKTELFKYDMPLSVVYRTENIYNR